MNEPEKQSPTTNPSESGESTATPGEERVTATYETVDSGATTKRKLLGSFGAVVVVGLILFGVLYALEREGRVSTGIFGGLIAQQAANSVVARVNDEVIVGRDLETSVQQFREAAAAQGMDLTSADAQTEIRAQALEVLINTELLMQEAVERGIEVSDQQAVERLATIEEEIGGADALAERMATLGLDEAQLQSDIRDEILIQELLDTVFLEAEIEVTEEEIASVYENAGAAGGELPPLEEVRGQIESQIVSSKEQEVVDQFITELRADAEIEIVE